MSFPEEGLQFLRDLAANNNKAWFEENKDTYLRALREPALAFIVELGEQLKNRVSPDIIYDTRTNGAGSLFRIHRDIRFSEDKTPYKTTVDMVFWQGDGKKMESPGFGVRVTPNGVDMFAGIRGFPKPMLQAYQQAVVDDSLGADLEAVIAKVQAAGYPIEGEHYKRVPRGYDKDHPRAHLLLYAGLYASHSGLNPVASPDLAILVADHLEKMSPVQQWLTRL